MISVYHYVIKNINTFRHTSFFDEVILFFRVSNTQLRHQQKLHFARSVS